MNDQEILDRAKRAAMSIDAPDHPYDALLRRRDHKRRNQRVAAGVLGIAVFAFAAVGLVRLLASERGAVIGPAASPSPVASSPVTQPSSFTERFDSPLNGLSIGYPSGWRTRAATEPWGHGELAFDASDVDVIFDPQLRDDLYIALVSAPLGGKSPMDWTNLPDFPPGMCTRGGGGGSGNGFQGNEAWFEYCGEGGGARGIVLTVATETRGYFIYLHVADERRLLETYDTHWFWGRGGLLKTVELRPEEALDASNPSRSP